MAEVAERRGFSQKGWSIGIETGPLRFFKGRDILIVRDSQMEKPMQFISVRIITAEIDRLVAFYERVLNMAADRPVPIFAEFRTSVGTLAIGAQETLAPFGGPDIARPSANHSAIIEFQVEDVDREYDRLKDLIDDTLVQAPTTMPWGNRSLLFRDPDGGLVNLFTPVTPEAIAKFQR